MYLCLYKNNHTQILFFQFFKKEKHILGVKLKRNFKNSFSQKDIFHIPESSSSLLFSDRVVVVFNHRSNNIKFTKAYLSWKKDR